MLVKELFKLSAIVGLTVTTTLSVDTYYANNLEVGTLEANTQAESKAQSSVTERDNENLSDLMLYIQRFESAGAVNSQRVQSPYQVVYGGIAAKDRPTSPLTSMTVEQVLDWQDNIDTRYPSEAAGAYQVMEDTLRGLVDAGSVRPEALFDEETQDFVAQLLMERRGLSKYLEGEISAEDFADSLAREWASFPVVRDQRGAKRYVKRGQSYYAGDGLNSAHAQPDEFLKIVREILSFQAVDRYEVSSGTLASQVSAVSGHQHVIEPTRSKPSRFFTIEATKSAETPINLKGKVEMIDYRNWDLSIDTSYEIGTKSHEVGGSASYERDAWSLYFGGKHTSTGRSELQTRIEYRF